MSNITGDQKWPELPPAFQQAVANGQLFDVLPIGIYCCDRDGLLLQFNRKAAELWGRAPGLGDTDERFCGSHRLFWPDGTLLPHAETPMAEVLRTGVSALDRSVIVERPDGTRVTVLAFPTPLYDERGSLLGAINMLVDITERKEAEQRQQLLIGELNHRVRNTLAMVQAMARQTLGRTRNPADFVSSFSGRVQALARAHALLTQSTWRGADVLELVRDQLLLGSSEDERTTCSGPSLMLEPQPALHLALALHELGTNARKHGALSGRAGRLSVSWKVQSNGGRRLLLSWSESGGPAIAAPAARGFGTALVEQCMEAHGGEACLCYGADGVRCEIRLPLPELQRAAPDAIGAAMGPRGTDGPAAHRFGEETMITGKRILVIEDEPLVSMDIVASLEAAGYAVVGPAGTLGKARQLIERERFDAALVDAHLAGEPVDEVVAALARQEVPFAFVTGYGREGLPKAFAGAPMLGKPFASRDLCDTVKQLLQLSGKVVRLRRSMS